MPDEKDSPDGRTREYRTLTERVVETLERLRACGVRVNDPAQSVASLTPAETAEKPFASQGDAKARFGSNLDRLRKEKGWSIEKLAKEAGVDKSRTARHVRGKEGAHLSTKRAYADVLGVKISDLEA